MPSHPQLAYRIPRCLPPFLSVGMYKNSTDFLEQDALQQIFFDIPSHSHIPQRNTMIPSPHPSETDPLLPVDPPVKKPFYRPRPLWYVPLSKSRCASLNHSSFRSPPGLSHLH